MRSAGQPRAVLRGSGPPQFVEHAAILGQEQVYQLQQHVEVAGAGSLYVCANALGLPSARTTPRGRRTKLPAVLVPVGKTAGSADGFGRTGIEPSRLHDAQRDANLWLETNFTIAPDEYKLYYLYGLERYHGFQEAAEGYSPAEPEWYSLGVEWLAERQADDGSWSGCGTTVACDTAFAVLFLIRSTKRSLTPATEGVLHGGIGLPTNAADVGVSGPRLVARESHRQLLEALAMLEEETAGAPMADNSVQDPPADDTWLAPFGSGASAVRRSSASDGSQDAFRRDSLTRLSRLVRTGNARQRLAAVRVLSACRHLDAAPVLIEALGDEDEGIAVVARDGLRFLSRKLEGFGLERPFDAKAREAAQSKWRQWYRLVRPEAEFWTP